ncbi:hypothetical protein ANTRET_LOCUS1273 [Anthophora retusa]
MSKEGNSEETPQEGAGGGGGGGGDASKKDDIYETGKSKKIVRLITVMAYMFSVSFVAIVLSAYYLFLWEPPNPRLLRRPVHLLSEPEMQFLLSDPSSVENESNQPPKKSFLGRTFGKDNLTDSYDPERRREKLDESMFLLRNSLVELLQNRINDSETSDKYITSKSRRTWQFFNHTLSDKRETTNSSRKVLRRSSKILDLRNRTFDNNSTPLTLNSSTIPGDEANNDHFTRARKISVQPVSPLSVFGSRYNLSNDTAKNRETYGKSIFTSSEANTETSNERGVKIVSLRSGENVEVRRNGNNVKQGVNLNKQSTTHSHRNVELADRPQHPDRSNESPAELLKFKETQLKQTTTKLMTVTNEQSPSQETLPTEQQKDSITISTETTDIPSSASPLTISEDLQANASIEMQEPSTKIQSEINQSY